MTVEDLLIIFTEILLTRHALNFAILEYNYIFLKRISTYMFIMKL